MTTTTIPQSHVCSCNFSFSYITLLNFSHVFESKSMALFDMKKLLLSFVSPPSCDLLLLTGTPHLSRESDLN